MTFVVTKRCIGCKDTACVNVCPCDCFHEGPEMLFINADLCIDCAACAPACPVDAIYQDDEVSKDDFEDIELNLRMAQIYPVIFESKKK